MNYIIPRFVLDNLPIGLAGLFIAAVIAAAMNAISGELMSLSTATVIFFGLISFWALREFITLSNLRPALRCISTDVPTR